MALTFRDGLTGRSSCTLSLSLSRARVRFGDNLRGGILGDLVCEVNLNFRLRKACHRDGELSLSKDAACEFKMNQRWVRERCDKGDGEVTYRESIHDI